MQLIKLPQVKDKRWNRVIDTSLKSGDDFLAGGSEILLDPDDHYLANPRSTVVLIGR
ncbi:MAG: hypothetical protein HY754_12660 [Nitrospirae bacterium]|nr:hypothetical protein [Nitrospirota bacterium]